MAKPKLKIVERSVDELIPYINNAKTHSDHQISLIAASIKEFGFNNPILTDTLDGIIAGHGRLEAAIKLGYTTVPTIELPHLTDTQRRAYILADNRLAEVGTEWDIDLVMQELDTLTSEGFEIDFLEFDFTGSDDTTSSGSDDLGDVDSMYQIVIDCETPEEQERLLERFIEEGLTCKPLIL